jgi:sugar/nucleoside kinase (ribokinase family)
MIIDVLVVGDYCLDVILTGLNDLPTLGQELYAGEIELTVGGGALPTAAALRRLGMAAELNIPLGDDFFSAYVHEQILAAGFDPALLEVHDQPVRRLTVALSYPHDRAFVSYLDPSPSMHDPGSRAEDLFKRHRIRHLHFAHLSAAYRERALMDAAHRNGTSISLDCGWNLDAMDDPAFLPCLKEIDVFMPNEAEARYLTKADDLSQALSTLTQHTKQVVIKLGAEGAVAGAGNGTCQVAAIPIEALDTTAAGDCFNAGFLYGWLKQWSPERALLCGNICGGLSTTARGWQATPDAEGLQEWLERLEHVGT